MGIHEWSYDSQVAPERRSGAAEGPDIALKDIRRGGQLRFDPQLAWKEAQRCLNTDVQTVFAPKLCIECGPACVDVCPMDCITFTADGGGGCAHASMPRRRSRPGDLRVGRLKTGRVMAKDEDVCLHCGLCAERCPTGAWDMPNSCSTRRPPGRGAGPRQSPESGRLRLPV
jgi:ferredoxin